ncbi:MAG: type II/IV secretion system protein [Prosthecobacter sp.]|jgi:type IV pilus assembly protein PilB|uniref:GspE/PulE family protein n=1 Tax=Prosthecobacter sp. TaxID=1965333 RepID=UPI0019DA5EE0|nr:GspE/PulE family protein [Prosthecobacter sp.]MBE2282351.1 type II/IV secretion system protein [Prosthecobacter sp.]
MTPKNVVDMLETRGVIDNGVAYDIEQDAVKNGKDIVQVLIDYGIYTNEDEFWAQVADELGADHFDLDNFEPPPSVVALIPPGMGRLYGAFPITLDGQGLHVAFTDPLNPQLVEDLRFGLEKTIVPVVARRSQVQALIEKHYGSGAPSIDEIFGNLGKAGKEGVSPEAEANSAPIVKFVDLVMHQAIKERASDIHFEPFEREFKIRYRVDGALYEMAPPPVHLANSIISRVKVMANMNIAERRIPQDGRIMTTVNGKAVDMRVNSLPTQHGESVVLRVLDRSSIQLELSDLGMSEGLRDYIEETIHKPNGIFIVTGPTGAGKTTTLYACLRKINTIDSKLLTAEDPVEYELDGIMQVPVNDAVGLTFAKALRAFLRQDPDRIMVGEMRDLETAQIAIQASLTGHLVLSTLHTNDSAGAVTRLVDMGVEPFMVSATLEGVLAQRLLRTICKSCRSPYEPSLHILNQLNLTPDDIGGKHFFTGAGCSTCGSSGYKGRRGIYELLDVTDPIRELITGRAPSLVLRQKAIELGMATLREDGLRSIFDGETTIEEVLKYT